MCEFSCDTCSPPLGFGSVKYDCWVDHLISDTHQVEVKKKLDPRKWWRDEKDSYVLTWTASEVPWSLRELAEWLSVFGVVTELMYDTNYGFCVFTLQGFGALGLEKVKSVSNQKELRGCQIAIKPKKRLKPQDWNLVYESGNSRSKTNSTDALPVAASSSSVPKGPLVFTNQNKSSNNNYRQQNPSSANFSVKAQTSQESISSSLSSHNASRSNSITAITVADKKTLALNKDSVSDGKANKKRKSAERKKANERQGGDSVTQKQILNTSSNSNPKIAVPPSSLAPKNAPPKAEEFPPLSPIKPQQQHPEPLNFRGGFTPSGRRDREYRMSESSDGNQRVEQQQQAVTPSSSATVQILQRTIANEGQGSSSQGAKDQRQKQTRSGNANKTPQQQRQNFPVRNHQVNESHPPVPPSMRQYHQQQQPQQQQHNFLISPIFTFQLTPALASVLSNPMIPKSRNPYRFDNVPPFSYFFDLFQKLPDESFKPQKELLYKQFQLQPLAAQLEEFFSAQALPGDEIRLRWQVILDILFILRQHYPRCELYAFGSILTGLGDFTSDIDIYVDLTGDSTSSKPINPAHKLSGHEAVDIVKKILRKSQCPHNKNRFVQHLIPVKSARVPILKITHQTTKINCDLSFENRLSVQNTKLLSFYLNFDVKIFRFMVLIRYWGKFHHLTGSNHIKNYALNLLVLVYMTKKGYVPTIDHLQRLKEAERKQKRVTQNPDEIEGWDSSFCDNISIIRQNFQAVPLPSSSPMDNKNNNHASQTQTLIQMAIEFFEMFANLDFSQVVVCPLMGDILPKKNFCAGSEERLPKALDRYKNWAVQQPMNRRLNVRSHLCVQDPFVLSFNVGSVTPQGTLLRFQIACAKSAQILNQKNGLKSLLDVLARLPAHIGEKKFMRAHKTERMSQDLKREIKRAVVNVDGAVAEEIPQTPLAQKSSYVTLPAHLRAFDKLIDEKALKQESKRPRWENFLDFNVNSQLETLFVTEVTRFGYAQTTKRPILMDNLRTLWHQFSMDFVRDFFDIGLKLTTVQSKDVTVEADDSETNSDVKGEDGGGGKQRWKMYLLNGKEEEKVMAMGSKSAEEVGKFTEKIKTLPSIPGQVNYKVVTYRVTYPFWERRPLYLSKVAKEMKVSDMVQIPVAPTTNKTKSKDKNSRGKKSKENKNEKSKEKNNGHWNCFDPIDLEAKVSENIWKAKEEFKNFQEFQLNVLVKLDLSTIDDKPEMFLVFEKDLSLTCNSTDYFRAIQCVANILSEAFPRYQIFRLAKWLDLPSPSSSAGLANIVTEAASSSKAASKENAAQDKQPTKEDDGTEETDAGEKNKEKKKARTKLEEELLIPSSSSSTCSDKDDNDNNGLEELSDDDDDEDQNDASEQSEEESNEINSAVEQDEGEETKENKSSSSA